MCPKPIHPSEDLRQFSRTTNSDSNSEFIGAGDSGEHIDCVNMRHDEFDKDSKTKIGGEREVYSALATACYLAPNFPTLDPNYKCIGSRHFFLEDDGIDH